MVLLGLGCLFAGLLPVSYFVNPCVVLPWPGDQTGIRAVPGHLLVWNIWQSDLLQTYPQFEVTFERAPSVDAPVRHATLRPSYSLTRITFPGGQSVNHRGWSIPLWLLAIICLAWPVTSFIIARWRRKGRGFEVEARRCASPAEVLASS